MGLKVQAAATFSATFGRLDIVGVDDLQTACESEITMMCKLSIIARKMTRNRAEQRYTEHCIHDLFDR